jgi:hypothetical protein
MQQSPNKQVFPIFRMGADDSGISYPPRMYSRAELGKFVGPDFGQVTRAVYIAMEAQFEVAIGDLARLQWPAGVPKLPKSQKPTRAKPVWFDYTIETFENYSPIKLKSNPPSGVSLEDVSERIKWRHVLVHADGLVDAEFQQSFPGSRYKDGDTISISNDDFFEVRDWFRRTVNHIAASMP